MARHSVATSVSCSRSALASSAFRSGVGSLSICSRVQVVTGPRGRMGAGGIFFMVHYTSNRNGLSIYIKRILSRVEPMLVDLDLDEVVVRALVVRPYLSHREANSIEHALGFATEAIGELFRIGESTADALDSAGLATDVPGRAPMAGWIAGLYPHAVAGAEAHFFGAGWMLSTQCTSSGFSTTGMSRFTTTGSWPLRHRTQESASVSLALISWCGT